MHLHGERVRAREYKQRWPRRHTSASETHARLEFLDFPSEHPDTALIALRWRSGPRATPSGSTTALDPALRSILIDKATPRKRRCGAWDEPRHEMRGP